MTEKGEQTLNPNAKSKKNKQPTVIVLGKQTTVNLHEPGPANIWVQATNYHQLAQAKVNKASNVTTSNSFGALMDDVLAVDCMTNMEAENQLGEAQLNEMLTNNAKESPGDS